MAKKWTVRERREHAKEKYHDIRLKVFVLIASAVVIAALFVGVYYSIIFSTNPLLIVALIIALIVAVPLAIFIIDIFWFEYT